MLAAVQTSGGASGKGRALTSHRDGFRGLLEFLEFRLAQEPGDIQEDNKAALELSHAGDIARLALGKHGAGRFDFRRRDLQDLGGGTHNESEELVIEFDDENAILFVRLDSDRAEALAQIHDRNDLAAKIDDTLNDARSVGHRGDVRDANNFAHGSDTNPIGFVSDAEANDLEIFLHEALSGSGTSDFG